MNHNQKPQERTCSVCGSVFTASNAKHTYCSSSCRKANHLHHKAQQARQREDLVRQQGQQVAQKTAEIDQLKAAPRSQTVREVNPAWRLAQQSWEDQDEHCQALTQALEEAKQDEKRQRAKPQQGAFIGAGLGIGLVLIWMSKRIDERQRHGLGLSFVTTSLMSMFVLGYLGYVLGKAVHDRSLSEESRQALEAELAKIVQRRLSLQEQLNEALTQREALRLAASRVLRYLSETVISSAEEGGPPPALG